MKKLYYIILSTFLAFAGMSQAQIVIHDYEFENFEYNIKQIDEFILRFNLKELLIQPDQSAQYKRDNRILLFDKNYYLANEETLTEFLNTIEKEHTTLSFYDSTWYAIAECNVTFQGKKDKLTLILRTEQVKDDIYKWSLVDAQGAILELTPRTKSDKLRLLPTDNEVNFIALQSITTTNAPNITLYDVKSHANDRLSVFNSLVYYKLLKVDNVQELTYCFTQVKGYKFYVKNFTREAKNAGWLIYEVKKENIKDKNKQHSDSTFVSAQQKVTQLYRMLSDYAKNPANIALAKSIKALFKHEQKGQYFFGAKHIYDDIDVYVNKHPSLYAYVSISEYLNSLDNIASEGVILSYQISDFKIVESVGSTIKVSYKLSIKDKETTIGWYYANATLQEGSFVNIIPLNEFKSQNKGHSERTLVITPSELSLDASGGTRTVTVHSNTNWEISMNPASWVHLTRSDNTLTLRVDENTSTISRADYFKIKAGDKEERVRLEQKGQEDNKTNRNAHIHNCWLTHNLTRSMWNGYMLANVNYMQIHCHFEVNGHKGENIRVCAFFYHANGEKVNAIDKEFRSTDGLATVQGTERCSYDGSEWKDYCLDIPYYALPQGDLTVQIQIQDKNGGLLAESTPLSFSRY